jgi:electron transfer flavoprotein beta subunit
MGPPIAESALQQAQLLCDADELHLYSDRIFAGADTLATAEVLKAGMSKGEGGGKVDIVFSGHRASDGETGQTGPQTAWKLGYTFLGNVMDYNVDLQSRLVRAKRLISLQGFYDIIEEVEAPLPVFISIDPSYKAFFNTVSQRLAFEKFLKVLNTQQLGIDAKLVGLPGSPTIVYKVERIPKAKASRKAEVIDGTNRDQIARVAANMYEALGGMVIK